MSKEIKPSIVLVHGSWADATSWQPAGESIGLYCGLGTRTKRKH